MSLPDIDKVVYELEHCMRADQSPALGDLRDAITLLRRMQWHPISTAPKDGTHFLVCTGPYSGEWTFDHRPPMVVHWYPGYPDSTDAGFYLSNYIVADSYNDKPMSFTHWMPLPEPPEDAT